jgi:hypothetical protein
MGIAVGPVVGPIVRPQPAHGYAGQGLDRLAPVRGHATARPVRHRLHGFAEGIGQGLEAAGLPAGLVESVFFHPPILNAPFSACQQVVAGLGEIPGMATDPVWTRVMDEAERNDSARPQQWLTDRMNAVRLVSEPKFTIQRIQNWKKRGVPAKQYETLALALEKSPGWIFGHEEGKARDVTAAPPSASEADAEFLADFHVLPRAEREALREDVRQRAARYREYLAELSGGEQLEPAWAARAAEVALKEAVKAAQAAAPPTGAVHHRRRRKRPPAAKTRSK